MPTVEEMDNEKLPRGIEIDDRGDTLNFYGNHRYPTTDEPQIEGTSLWYVATTDWVLTPVAREQASAWAACISALGLPISLENYENQVS